MDIIQAIIIGLVQGIAEFLPISSSAHLIFVQRILGVSEVGLTFDLFLHLGTVIALIFYFRTDIYKLIKGWISSLFDIFNGNFINGLSKDPFKRLSWYIILATIPIGIVGFFFEDQISAIFTGALYIPAFFLFVTGTILYISQRINVGNINFINIAPFHALFMGLAQACAILPGLSRSGTTISAGLTANLDKEFAVKFSFILSIPAIVAALILKFKDITVLLSTDIVPILVGFFVAMISGYFAIKFLLTIIQKRSLDGFAYYCWIVGIVVFMGSVAGFF